ncbi:MAG: carboxypeptidase-like regulatory domain-containing protein [Myxococcota bacterium]
MKARMPRLALALAIALLGAAPTARADNAGPFSFHADAGTAIDDLDLLVDATRPQVQFIAPLEGSRLGGTSTTITGNVTDLSTHPQDPRNLPGNVFHTVDWFLKDGRFGPEVLWGSAPVVDGHFVIPDLPLLEGENALIVFARDAAGWYEGTTLVFDVDPNAPTAALVGVLDGQAVLSQSLSIDLNFAATTTVVSLNGVPDGRSFPAGLALDAFDLPLALGPNTFTLELESGGETSSFSFTFYRVASREPIAILQPIDGALVNTVTVPVSVRAPLGTPFVSLNGRPAVRGDDLQTFTADVPLFEGANTVDAIAYPFGQRASVRITRDTTPPRVISMAPGSGRTLLASTATIQGVVSEPAFLEIVSQVDFRDALTIPILTIVPGIFGDTLRYTHTFEFADFALDPGLNEILFVLRDRAGNSAVVPLNLTRSDSALRILDPVAGSSIPALETSLRLEALETLALQALYVGGRQLTSFRGRTLSAGIRQFDHIPLAPGLNDIRVVYQRFGGPQEVLVTNVTSTALPIATLRGQLTDAVTGTPIGGATVTITRGAEDLVLISGSDGRYQTDVPPGPFSLVVRRSGFIPAYLSEDAALGETLEMDAAMLRWTTGILPATLTGSGAASNHLEGVVTSAADGLPLAGAQVRVTSTGATLTALSGEDGAFEINGIPVGPFSVAVSKTGFAAFSYQIDNTEAVDVRLAPALRSVGSAVSVVATTRNAMTGVEEQGVRITLLGPNQQLLSDAHGRAIFLNVPAGTRSLRLEKPGFLDGFVQFEASGTVDGSPQPLALDYPEATGRARPVAISPDAQGTVRDLLSGAPLAGATVTAGTSTAVADADGRFQLSGLPALQDLRIVASAADHEPQSIHAVVLVNAVDPLEFGLRSSRRGYLTGVIRDASTGFGIEGASVQIGTSEFLRARTDSSGAYNVVAVPPGTYSVQATHPRYLSATTASVIVPDAAGATLDVALAHRPMTGGIAGTVTDLDSGALVAGAVVSRGALSATSNAAGEYALNGLPAGLVTLEIEAPGFPPTLRAVAVAADPDFSIPQVTRLDIALSLDATEPTQATAEIRSSLGGAVEMPGGRLRIDIPPLALAGDARVTLKLSDSPEVASGEPIPLDPELNAPVVRAVGPELEIRLEPLIPGGVVPKLIAPVILTAGYSAAEAAGVEEGALFPFGWDGTKFTVFRSVPYLHAVDEIDRVVVTGLDFSTTELGQPVVAGLVGKSLPLLAAAVPVPDDQVLEYYLQFAAKLEELVAGTSPTASLTDMRSNSDVGERIHANGLPLLLFHGWSVTNLLFATSPEDDPLDDDERFGQIIRDFLDATRGVYRPVYVGYNSRARASETANAVRDLIHGALGTGDAIRGLPSPLDPDSGRFEYVDSFGFSKGGLVERALQCYSGRTRGMVALATPHHGALQALVPIDGPLRDFIARLSPGTGDLFDYRETAAVSDSGNPFLANLNRSPCSASTEALSLVAGTDAIRIPLVGSLLSKWVDDAILAGELDESDRLSEEAINEALTIGNLVTGSSSDGVVPVWSAQGKDGAGFDVSALAAVGDGGLRVEVEDFNHLDVGEPGTQALSAFMARSVLPALSDWITVTEVPPEDPNVPAVKLPTVAEAGYIRKTLELEWHVPHGSISDILPVVYGRDTQGNWHILAGADPDTGAPDDGYEFLLHLVDQNSLEVASAEDRTIALNQPIPRAESGRPETFIVDVVFFLARLPYEDENLPMEPSGGNFGIPQKE